MTKKEVYLLMLINRTIRQLGSIPEADPIADSLEIDIGIRRGCENKETLDEIIKNYYKL